MTRRALQQQKISSRGISGEKSSARNTASFTMNNAIVGGFSIPSGEFTQVGALPVTGGELQLSYSFTGSTLYAIRNSGVNGSAVVYYSFASGFGNQGASWVTGATLQGAGSAYSAGILGISDSIVIAQQRAYFYRSTNSGASFTNILTTSSGQNNFYIPVFDGTYGYCGGYDQNVYSNDGWVTAATVSKGTPGFALASAPLSKNGANRFLVAGLGSSGSAASWWHITNTTAVQSSGSVNGNQNFVSSDPTSGLNAISSQAEGGGTNNIYYATYPSTTYSTANSTGLSTSRTGRICVSPQGKIVVPVNNGLWKLSTDGSAPVLISAITDIVDVVSDGTYFCYAIRSSTGAIYRFIAD
jgi:hypothetical protein